MELGSKVKFTFGFVLNSIVMVVMAYGTHEVMGRVTANILAMLVTNRLKVGR